ncbi:oxidoreductase [Nonomuraea muscovyensis]|uniref:NAD(P)-dependent dehydrogenase (Short-subunit alcohol dehydrogenase family) n=1 Tax=Nonomuraea muscovyensis TaxID=1124761 RepID=A0A7X0C9C3_9ACTN|nr:oxidoreductase [Nonomuraea muscovyensis]MBB6350483.1 NAD(P)-dependent dehydrogenase (short-subunit alcohol dehydrogenase family) [Nonomuraea muscovyensis]
MAPKVCLVTGASSGIGRATALELREAGHIVYGAARRVRRMDELRQAGGHAVAMDVTSEDDVGRVVRAVLDQQHRIDALINNAGIGLHGALEDVPLDRARHLFEVNVFGPARLTQLVLPHMRERRSGTIVNVSSIAGEIALPLVGWYHSSKHALEAYSDSLRQECGPFGVDVALIQPGIIRTEFEREMPRELRAVSGRGPYRELAEAMANRAESAARASDPVVVAKTIRGLLESPRPRTRYPVGRLARTILTLNRLLPDRAFDAMVTKID